MCSACAHLPARRSASFMLAPAGSRLAPVLATLDDVRRRAAAADDAVIHIPNPDPGLAQDAAARSRSVPSSPATAAAAAAAAAFGSFRAGPMLGFPLGSPTTEWLRDAAAAAGDARCSARGAPPGNASYPDPDPRRTLPLPPPVCEAGTCLAADGIGGFGWSALVAEDTRDTGDGVASGAGNNVGGALEEADQRASQGRSAASSGASYRQGSGADGDAPPGATARVPSRPPDGPADGADAGSVTANGRAHAHARAAEDAPARLAQSYPNINPKEGWRDNGRAGAPDSTAGKAALAHAHPESSPGEGQRESAHAHPLGSGDEAVGLGPGPVFVPIVLCMEEADHALLVHERYERQQVRLRTRLRGHPV